MSETLYEWIIVWTFFLLVVGFTFVEAVWLSRKGWAGFSKSLIFAALTNFIGYSIGFFVIFVIMIVFLMIIFDSKVNTSSTGNYRLIPVLGGIVLFTPLLLIICKRLFLSILKIQTGKSAWLYSVVSSVSSLVISLTVPILIAYFVYR